MTSMLIIHPNGQADSIRIEAEEFLKYAEYCNMLAGQLLRSHREWMTSKDAPKDALEEQMSFPLEA